MDELKFTGAYDWIENAFPGYRSTPGSYLDERRPGAMLDLGSGYLGLALNITPGFDPNGPQSFRVDLIKLSSSEAPVKVGQSNVVTFDPNVAWGDGRRLEPDMGLRLSANVSVVVAWAFYQGSAAFVVTRDGEDVTLGPVQNLGDIAASNSLNDTEAYFEGEWSALPVDAGSFTVVAHATPSSATHSGYLALRRFTVSGTSITAATTWTFVLVQDEVGDAGPYLYPFGQQALGAGQGVFLYWVDFSLHAGHPVRLVKLDLVNLKIVAQQDAINLYDEYGEEASLQGARLMHNGSQLQVMVYAEGVNPPGAYRGSAHVVSADPGTLAVSDVVMLPTPAPEANPYYDAYFATHFDWYPNENPQGRLSGGGLVAHGRGWLSVDGQNVDGFNIALWDGTKYTRGTTLPYSSMPDELGGQSWPDHPAIEFIDRQYIVTFHAWDYDDEPIFVFATATLAPPLRLFGRDDGLGPAGHARLNVSADISNQASSAQLQRAPRLAEGGSSYS